MTRPYTIAPDGASITCHRCGRTSHNRNDVEQRYCGGCHVFLDDDFPATAIPDFVCPSCGYRSDHAMSTMGDHVPEPGDLSICIGCAEVTQFNPDMTQRVLAPAEFLDLPIEIRRHIIRARAVLDKAKKKKAAAS